MAELAQPQNGLVSAADILAKLAPTFIGSGTTTKTESENSTSGIGDLSALLAGANKNASDPMAALKPVIDNIMRQAQVAFAPVVGQQNSAGMYNSNVLSMLASMAQGEAVRQSAQVVTDYQTSQQKLALSAAGSLAQATRQTTGTQQTGAAINPLASLGTVGAGIVGSKLINSSFVNRQVDSVGKALGIGGSAGTATAALPSDFLAKGGSKLFEEGSSDTAQTVGDFVPGGGGDFAGVGLPDVSASLPFESTGDLFSNFGVGGTSGDIGTLFGDIGLGAGEGAATSVAAGGGGDLLADVGSGISGAVSDIGSGIGDAASAVTDALSWIVCTELVRQGRMNKRWYISGSKVFAGYWKYGKRGYYIWAIPSVRHLRQRPNSIYSRMLQYVFGKRAEHLAAIAGVRGAKRSICGACISASLWYICAFLAITVSPFCRDPDWLALYGKEELR